MSAREAGVGHWLAAAQAGSKEALGEALEACRAYLLHVANQEIAPHLQRKGGASDLVQQTFLDAQRDFAAFRGDSDAEFRAWLREVLRCNLSHFARQYRARKRQAGLEVPLVPPGTASTVDPPISAATLTPSGNLMAKEANQAVEQALAQLPDDYRQVLALRYDEDLTFEEIAARMQRTPNAVRKLCARAIERLQGDLGPPP